ncbi:MAG: hypothetical protein JJ863_03600 [Deltaproteobacteria bacterium]|nr:hypothetical protein [Deltaproteobacteria bacterium]
MRSSSFALVLLVALGASASTAHADWNPDGSVAAQLHFELGDQGERGGTILVDLWKRFDLFRIGLAAGVGALTGGADAGESNRAFAPIGLTLGIAGIGDYVGGSLTVRAGPWGGATNDGLKGGLFVSVGGSLDIRWGERLAVAFVLDYWLIMGAGETRSTLAPGVALRWTWQEEEAPL